MVKLSLLCQILTNLGGMACDVNSLMSQASVFGKVTQDPFEMLELQLLCAISASAGGSGANVVCQAGPFAGAAPFSCGIGFDTNTGVQYNAYGGVWH